MKLVQPKSFITGETRIIPENFQAFLEEIGVPEWHSDGASDSEVIVEAAGKLCYMSFSTDLNKNLTKVGTRNNHDYIQEGLIATKHGSVLEHVGVNIIFTNVSRVLTHELVRHRAGAAYSQLSGRYVRVDELPFWIPTCIDENPELRELFIKAIEHQEETIYKMALVSGIENMTGPEGFKMKKTLTSAFRRIIGNGVANHIEATYNHRALRHLITMRTSAAAEEEIRVVFGSLALALNHRYPAIYADMKGTMADGHFAYSFAHEKV